MRIRRHFTSLGERGIAFDRRRALTWLGLGAGAVLAGYLTAYLILFPAPILPGHQAVPRVLGLTVAEAQAEIQKSRRSQAPSVQYSTSPAPTPGLSRSVNWLPRQARDLECRNWNCLSLRSEATSTR